MPNSDQRQYPRISIPLLVELKHPLIGTKRCTASNVSAGGLFIEGLDADALQRVKPQSRLKVSLLNTNRVEPHATPTVDMVVTRVEDNGLGLKYANQTSRFLWESAERRRVELAIGRDYFQVHISALVVRDRRLLLVERKGRWGFPGCYLTVGAPWADAVQQTLQQDLGLEDLQSVGPLAISDRAPADLPEAATLRVFYQFTTNSHKAKLQEESGYRDQRWLDRMRTLNDLTLIAEEDRQAAETLLRSLQDSNG